MVVKEKPKRKCLLLARCLVLYCLKLITERRAILNSACEKQIFHPLRMPVSQRKVNGHGVSLLRETCCSAVVIKVIS